MKHNTICVQLQWFPSAPTIGTSNKHDTFHQCCFIVPASVKDHGTTFIHQRRKVSCFPGAMYEDGRTRGLMLGDSGYPCLLYLTPIARPTTDNERHYNRSHIMTRNIIERLFGVLKHFLRRFACLHFGLRTKLSNRLIIIIVACCVLHNIARRHREIHIRCWVGWWPLHWWWHHWS